MISKKEKERVEKLAHRLNTYIPGDTPMELWSLGILESLADKIDRIEEKLLDVEPPIFYL